MKDFKSLKFCKNFAEEFYEKNSTKDPEAYDATIIRVSEDELLREHLGKEALKVSEKFSNIEMAYKYEKIYFEGDNNESFKDK